MLGAQSFEPPTKGSGGPAVPEEGLRGLWPQAAGPDTASPGSWLSLEPQWLLARRPQCGGRKKKQLCFAQSLAINQVPISSWSRFTYPKCPRQFLSPCRGPATLCLPQVTFPIPYEQREPENEVKVKRNIFTTASTGLDGIQSLKQCRNLLSRLAAPSLAAAGPQDTLLGTRSPTQEEEDPSEHELPHF